MDQFKTQFEMKEVIQRCLKECKEAGYIASFKTINAGEVETIVSQDAIADHISKTLIGELLEFEIIRKLSPVIRQQRSIERDLFLLDEKQKLESSFPNLRIGEK